MDIYLLSLIIILISQIIKNKKLQTCLCAIVLFFISAFRSVNVGGDLVNYIPYFVYSKNLSINEILNKDYEFGYAIFNKVISMVFGGQQFFLIVTSAFVIFMISKYIYENSEIPWLSFFLFVTLMFYASTLNLVRQTMAMSIVLVSINVLGQKKYKRFVLYVLIAFLFHRTAIIFILIYFISKYEINIKYILCVCLASFLILIFGDRIINLFLNSFDRYKYYTGIIVSGQGYGMLLLLIIITILGMVFGKIYSDDKNKLKIHSHMMTLSILMQVLALKFALFTRVTNYFSIALIVYIPNVINSRSEKEIKYIGIVFSCLLTILFYLYSSKQNLNDVLPYYFFWNN